MPGFEERTHYQRLGIDADATILEIRAAFRAMAKSAHPDAGGDPEAFRLLKDAFDTLSNGLLRKEYDYEIGATERQPVRVNKVAGWTGTEGDFTGSVEWPAYLERLANEPWRRGDEVDETIRGDARVVWSWPGGADRDPIVGGSIVAMPVGRELAACDVVTGAELWRCDLGALPAADPVLTDQLLVAISDGADVQAFETRTGTLLWQSRMKDQPTAVAAWGGSVAVGIGKRLVILDAASGVHRSSARLTGRATSLLHDDGVLVAHTDQDTLEGFDVRKGKQRFVVRDLPRLSTPPLVAAGQVWLAHTDGRIVGIDAAHGQAVVALAPGVLISGIASDGARSLLYTTTAGPAQVLAFTSGGHTRWHHDLPYVALAPALDEDHLYVITGDQDFVTYDRSSGMRLAQTRIDVRPEGHPVAAIGRVMVRDGDGTVWAVAPPSANV